jgi:hypothetical protein
MSFPTIPTVAGGDLLSSTTSPASLTHTFPNLSSLRGGAGPQAGDLLIAICVQYQGGTLNAEFGSWGAAFTETRDDALASGTGNEAIGVAHKIATGSESGTFTVTSAHSFKSVNFLLRIPAGTWHGTTIPEVQAATRAAGAVADPGSFDPANWAAEDTLWIAVAGQSETSTTGSPPTLDSPPTNYTGQLIVARVADAVGDITAGVAFRQLNASAEDVGPWTSTNAVRGNGIATVIAVRPAPAQISLDAQPGSFAVSDAASQATVVADRAVSAAPGSFAMTGLAASVPADRVVAADPGAYVFSGADAAIVAGRALDAGLGAYAVSGFAADLLFTPGGPTGFEIDAQPGSFVLSGFVAAAIADRVVNAVPGSYAVVGSDAALLAARMIAADLGAYAIAGSPASVVAGRALGAVPGAYVVAGPAAALLAGRALAADPGAYLVVGVAATLLVPGNFVLDATPGSYVVVGVASGTIAGRVLVAELGSYLVSGVDAQLLAARLLAALPGSYELLGRDAVLLSPAAALPRPEGTGVSGASGATSAGGDRGRVVVVGSKEEVRVS